MLLALACCCALLVCCYTRSYRVQQRAAAVHQEFLTGKPIDVRNRASVVDRGLRDDNDTPIDAMLATTRSGATHSSDDDRFVWLTEEEQTTER